MRPPSLNPRPVLAGLLLAGLGVALAPIAHAQPFGAWMTLSGPTTGFISIPSSADLNPASQITIEAWVDVSDANGGHCSTIAGKNFLTSWWIGLCGTTFRSFLKGSSSLRDAGTIPSGEWTHVAVTYDGATRKHYINGELVRTFTDSGPLPANTDVMGIGADISFLHTPAGAIDELRLWSVARTQDQIRATINVPLSAPQAGLVGVWSLDGGAHDAVGGHNGTVGGSGIGFFTFPVAISCGSSTSPFFCLNGRFSVSAKFRVGAPGTAESQANALPCTGSGCGSWGIFWFFAPDNWEVMVKSINGCALNSRYWLFSAATTNVFYRLEAFDIRAGVNKVYFNYPGPPAPAVTDTNAFATCP